MAFKRVLTVFWSHHAFHVDAIRLDHGQLKVHVRGPTAVFVRAAEMADDLACSHAVSDLPTLQISTSEMSVKGPKTSRASGPRVVRIGRKRNVVHRHDG